jgi:hypothetical protein
VEEAGALRARSASGDEPRPRSIEAAIDRDAPLDRVPPYLAIAASYGVDEVVIVSRRPVVESIVTLGEVRIDKVCALATLRLTPGAAPPEGIPTWGALAGRAADPASVSMTIGVPLPPRGG